MPLRPTAPLPPLRCWQMTAPGQPLALVEQGLPPLGDGQVLVAVAGCGVCHTDLGFLHDGVRTGKAPPLTLGHEIAGQVVQSGAAGSELVGRKVVVPAVIPCGECPLCRSGRGAICRAQLFFGSDLDGGFASHLVAPARGLCLVDEAELAQSGLALADLSVLADAISTPYQAIERSGLAAGEVAIVVGAGGVGGFAVQIARARGAQVIACDVDDERLQLALGHGARLAVQVKDRDPQEIRKEIGGWVKREGLSPFSWKIFETSGRAAGQALAFALLGYGAHLSIVGFTLDKVTLRLSNLMAFDATARGNWGCLPELYPAALALVLSGQVAITPFIERHPMARVNEVLAALHAGRLRRRPVLIPDFA